MGSPGSPVKSSTEHPASPAAVASRTVSATPSGSSAKPFSRSAVTGSSVAWTTCAACSTASSRVTRPSARPRVAANPLLVVARAWKPREASSTADPRSHGLGSSSGRRPRCRARNPLAFSACSVIAGAPWSGRAPFAVRLPLSRSGAGVGEVEVAQLAPGAYAELGVDLVQVVGGRVPAQEQPVGDLLVAQPLGGEAGDLMFLRRQLL